MAQWAIALRRALLFGLCVVVNGCGGGSTPTAPTAAATRIINLSGNLTFGAVLVGQEVTAQFVISNTGNSTLTITGLTAPSGGAYSASFTSGSIGAGSSQAVTVFF